MIGEMLAVAPGPGRRRRLRGALGPHHRHRVQAAVTARAFYRSIRALSDVDARVDAGDFRLMSRATVDAVNAPARAPPRAAAGGAGAGLPERLGRLRARRPRRRRLEVPAGQDDPALGRRRHRVLDRPAAVRDLAGPARRAGRARRARLRARRDAARQHRCPAGPRPSSSSRRWARCSCSRLGILGEYVGRTYAALQAPPGVLRRPRLPRRGRTAAARVRPGSDRRPRRPTWSSSARAAPSGRGRAASASRCRSRRRSRTRRRR